MKKIALLLFTVLMSQGVKASVIAVFDVTATLQDQTLTFPFSVASGAGVATLDDSGSLTVNLTSHVETDGGSYYWEYIIETQEIYSGLLTDNQLTNITISQTVTDCTQLDDNPFQNPCTSNNLSIPVANPALSGNSINFDLIFGGVTSFSVALDQIGHQGNYVYTLTTVPLPASLWLFSFSSLLLLLSKNLTRIYS